MKKRMSREIESAPLLLALDTSSTECVVGLAAGTVMLAETRLLLPNSHSEHLAGTVRHLLSVVKKDIRDLAAIILSAGPGSFTGLRIGYSFAKGLASAAQIPLIEIPTLQLWARQYLASAVMPILPLIDARREEVYAALFGRSDGELKLLREPELLSIDALGAFAGQPVIATGGDLPELAVALQKSLPAGSQLQQPLTRAPALQTLFYDGNIAFTNRHFADLSRCEPLYMRPFKGVL